jgi:hypothetical protein
LKSGVLTQEEATGEWNILHKKWIDYFYGLPNITSLIQPRGILSCERREYNRGKRQLIRHRWRWEDDIKIDAEET